MNKVKPGDLVFNNSTQEWEKVLKVEPLSSGINGYKEFMARRGITQQVETASGFVICITPGLKVRSQS